MDLLKHRRLNKVQVEGVLSMIIINKPLPEQPLLIYPPRTHLVFTVLRCWLLLFLAILLTFGMLVFVAIPVYFFFINRYYWFTKLWRLYRYSISFLHFLTILVSVITITTAAPLRQDLLTLLSLFYHFVRSI